MKDEKALTDGWHYLDDRDVKHKENYIEWKYFNFKQKDIAGYIVYFILDPEQKTKIGGARILARVFHKDKFSGSIREIPMDKVQIDELTAGIDVDGAKIFEKDQQNYEISGKAENLTWDLKYRQLVPSIDAFNDIECGVLRWEKAYWLVKMPRASVTGTIIANNEKVEIDAVGYTDTNWGNFLPFFSQYEWGQFNDERLSFVFGVLYRMTKIQNTYFYIFLDKEEVWLKNPKFSIKHKKWGTSKHDKVKVPLETDFCISDEQYTIRFTSKLVNSDLLGLKISALLPKPAVSEQIVEYKGSIEKDGRIIYEFDSLGFQEWSVKTWKKTQVVF